MKGFSRTNLLYMRAFAEAYPNALSIMDQREGAPITSAKSSTVVVSTCICGTGAAENTAHYILIRCSDVRREEV